MSKVGGGGGKPPLGKSPTVPDNQTTKQSTTRTTRSTSKPAASPPTKDELTPARRRDASAEGPSVPGLERPAPKSSSVQEGTHETAPALKASVPAGGQATRIVREVLLPQVTQIMNHGNTERLGNVQKAVDQVLEKMPRLEAAVSQILNGKTERQEAVGAALDRAFEALRMND